MGTAYLLTSTAATPLFGKLSDIYGRRALFQAAIVIFVVGSLVCGISQSLLQLVLARGVQGVGGGGLLAMGLVIIGDVVSPRERGRYTALMTGVFAVAAVAGPVAGRLLRGRSSAGGGLPDEPAPGASWPWWSPPSALRLPHHRRSTGRLAGRGLLWCPRSPACC